VSTASFFAAPNYGGDNEPARPKAVNPRTGKEQSWTRASTFASALKNPHGLIRWKMRDLVMGLSLRPDLCRMLLAGTPIEDKAKADEIISQAIGMMAPEAKANEGTAAHTALMRSWVHQDEAPPEEFVPLIQAFASALREHGLTPKAAEQRVLNLAYNSMGSLDWVFEEANGAFVIGDVKTGKLEDAKREFAVQLALYDGAEFVVHPDGTVEPIPWPLAHSHAVLVHIDLEHGNAVSVYRVDLNIGRHGAGLAELNRGWAKLDPLTPYVRPLAPQRVANQGTVPSHHDGGPMVPPVGAVFEGEEPEAVAEVDLDQNMPGDPAPPAEDRFAHWMKLDKAPLQMELKKRGWTDISHNRRWLARALVVIEQGWTDQAMIKKYAAAKDDWSPEEGYTAPAPEPEVGGAGVPFEPSTPPAEPLAQGPSTETLAAAIAGANSVGAIEALRSDIVERRGDQAWTDALVAQARNRAYELGELPISEAAMQAVFEQIRHAANQEALKDLWVRTTIGGSCPERWTQAMTDAGTARLAAIAAALPPAPTNPFGG
jgi:hypothetical protein